MLTATQTKGAGFDFSVYTGDLVSHDLNQQLSRAYVEYTEVSEHGVTVTWFIYGFALRPSYSTSSESD